MDGSQLEPRSGVVDHGIVRSGFRKLYDRSDAYAFWYKDDWLKYISQHLMQFSSRPFANARVMELGAGVHNPLACAISAISMGASSAVAIEPGRIEPAYLEHALDHAMFLSALDQDRGCIRALCTNLLKANLSDAEVDNLLSRCGIELFGSGVLDYPSGTKFDIVHSCAVLEHVFDFNGTISHLSGLTKAGGLHVHKVDYIDHDYYALEKPEEIDKFRFLFRGVTPQNDTCNRMRPTEMIEVFERHDLRFLGFTDKWQGEFLPEFRALLDDKFHGFETAELAVTAAVMVFEKV